MDRDYKGYKIRHVDGEHSDTKVYRPDGSYVGLHYKPEEFINRDLNDRARNAQDLGEINLMHELDAIRNEE